jgi:hypothetical protein
MGWGIAPGMEEGELRKYLDALIIRLSSLAFPRQT